MIGMEFFRDVNELGLVDAIYYLSMRNKHQRVNLMNHQKLIMSGWLISQEGKQFAICERAPDRYVDHQDELKSGDWIKKIK